MIQEFKQFALRGNVVDLAVGVVIGAAFGAIVASLVADIIMPIIGALTGGLDFSNYYLALTGDVPTGAPYAAAKEAGAGHSAAVQAERYMRRECSTKRWIRYSTSG